MWSLPTWLRSVSCCSPLREQVYRYIHVVQRRPSSGSRERCGLFSNPSGNSSRLAAVGQGAKENSSTESTRWSEWPCELMCSAWALRPGICSANEREGKPFFFFLEQWWLWWTRFRRYWYFSVNNLVHTHTHTPLSEFYWLWNNQKASLELPAVLEALSTYEFSEAVHPSPLSEPRAQAQVAEQVSGSQVSGWAWKVPTAQVIHGVRGSQ